MMAVKKVTVTPEMLREAQENRLALMTQSPQSTSVKSKQSKPPGIRVTIKKKKNGRVLKKARKWLNYQ